MFTLLLLLSQGRNIITTGSGRNAIMLFNTYNGRLDSIGDVGYDMTCIAISSQQIIVEEETTTTTSYPSSSSSSRVNHIAMSHGKYIELYLPRYDHNTTVTTSITA